MVMDRPQVVDEFLNTFLSDLQSLLAANLVGLYLRGSLATGDFRPESSDIDLLAVTESLVSDAEYARLLDLHTAIAQGDHPFARRVEIEYIDRAALRRFQPGQRFPGLGQGETLVWREHHTNWILERWMVREQGIVLFGPPPKTLIDPIAPSELSSAVRNRLQDWAAWASDINDPEWHLPRRHKAYVVETMCRALYTMAKGEIGSKAQSAEWARRNLPEPWRSLVEQSQSWRTDDTVDDSLILPVRAFVLWAAESAFQSPA